MNTTVSVWHITIASVSRMPLFRTEAQVRRAIRRMAGLKNRRCVLFCFVDDHLHFVVVGERSEISRTAAAIARALRSIVSAELAPAFIQPVESRAHLRRLVTYTLTQTQHHGLAEHPALWTGSCFSDLVGARDVPVLEPGLGGLLPRLRMGDFYEAVGLPRQGVRLPTEDELRMLGPVRIAGAAAAAACAPPDLRGMSAPVQAGRRATAHIAGAAGISSRDLAWALGVTPRSARRESAAPVRPQLLHATRLRLAIEDAVATRPGRNAA